MIKKITNLKAGKIYANWSLFDAEGKFVRERSFMLDAFALAREVSFIDAQDYKCFLEQNEHLLSQNEISIGEMEAKKADQEAEKGEEKSSGKLRENAKKTEQKIEVPLSEEDKKRGAKAEIEIGVQ